MSLHLNNLIENFRMTIELVIYKLECVRIKKKTWLNLLNLIKKNIFISSPKKKIIFKANSELYFNLG